MIGYKEYAKLPLDDYKEPLEGGGLPIPFYTTTRMKDPSGKMIDVYKKIKFKDYETHGIDPKRPFPFLTRDYSKAEVILDFLQLVNESVGQYNLNNYPDGKKLGNIANGFFFDKERMKTLSSKDFTHPTTGERKKVSKVDLWNDLETRKLIYERAYHLRHPQLVKLGLYNHAKPDDMFKQLRGVQLRPAMEYLTDTQNQFKAYVAKVIYNYFEAKNVFDFCAGFAGRCVGALSLNINYTGIDSNTNLIQPYEEMLDTLKPFYNSTATILFSQAEKIDPSQFTYDFVFTSPPYWNTKSKGQTELYSNMEDYSEKAFFNDFLIPSACGAFKHLPENKFMVLNTYYDNIKILEKYIGIHKFKFRYKTKARAGTAGNEAKYAEYCYVYQRTARAIRLMERNLASDGIKLGGYGSAKEILKKKGSGSKMDKIPEITKELEKERTKERKERGAEDTLEEEQEEDPDTEEEEEEKTFSKPKAYKNINASVAKVKKIQLHKAPDVVSIPEYKTINFHKAHIRNVERKGFNTIRKPNIRMRGGFFS